MILFGDLQARWVAVLPGRASAKCWGSFLERAQSSGVKS